MRKWEVDPGKGPDGRRRGRRFFDTESEAIKEWERQQAHYSKYGPLAAKVDLETVCKLVPVLERVGWDVDKLNLALNCYLKHQPLRQIMFEDMARLVVAEKAAAQRGTRHATDLDYTYRRFAEQFGRREISSIVRVEIRRWLKRQQLGAAAYNKTLSALRQIWAAALEEEYCNEDPTEGIARKSVRLAPTPPLRPAALLRLFETLSKPDYRDLLATEYLKLLGCRTGELVPAKCSSTVRKLRRSKQQVLAWEDIDLAGRVCTIPVAVAKPGTERRLELDEGDVAVLMALRGGGQIAPRNYWKRRAKLRDALEFPLPRNGLRRALATYRAAAGELACSIVDRMGTSLIIFEKHYRRQAAPGEAQEFAKVMDAIVDLVSRIVRVERRGTAR